MKRKIKGFTLIESVLVTGFVALASVGIYTIFNKAQAINVANDEAVLLNKFKNDIVQMYESEASYAGLDNTVLNLARVTPIQMRDATATNIINRFGGNVVVAPIPFGGIANTGFSITYPNVKIDSCPKIATTLEDRFDRITIGTTQVKAYGSQGVDPSVVATACSSGAASGVQMVFDYISSFQVATAAAVPPRAPAPGTQFSMAPNAGICDISSPDFSVGDPAIPTNVRNNFIFAFRSVDNHAGRCPALTDYTFFLNMISTNKASNPSLTYTDVFTNIVEPVLLSAGTFASYATAISDGNALCNAASSSVYGVPVASSYIPYSGNKCRVN